ncbi:MAG: ECF transporter S component [Spirochaetota bacterium]
MQAQKSNIRRPLLIGVITVCSLGLNLTLSALNTALALPLFLDAIGTSIAAVTVGLAPALVVAVGTNVMFEIMYPEQMMYLPFAICGIATVVILRAFVKRGAFSSVGHALLASIAVAIANAVLGGIVAAFVYGGVTGVGIDFLVTGLVASGQSLLSASFWARVPANIIDKTIAVFAAYVLAPVLRGLESRVPGDYASDSQ